MPSSGGSVYHCPTSLAIRKSQLLGQLIRALTLLRELAGFVPSKLAILSQRALNCPSIGPLAGPADVLWGSFFQANLQSLYHVFILGWAQVLVLVFWRADLGLCLLRGTQLGPSAGQDARD